MSTYYEFFAGGGMARAGLVKGLRDHPDLRIARRAGTLAKLAQKISERNVDPGLRRALVSQSTRLLDLATKRYEAVKLQKVKPKRQRRSGTETIEDMLDGIDDGGDEQE